MPRTATPELSEIQPATTIVRAKPATLS